MLFVTTSILSATRILVYRSSHLQHVVVEPASVAHALAVAQHVEVEHAERLHLTHRVALVEQEQVLAAHLQHADHLALASATNG